MKKGYKINQKNYIEIKKKKKSLINYFINSTQMTKTLIYSYKIRRYSKITKTPMD